MQTRHSFSRDPGVPGLTVRKYGGILLHQDTVDLFGLMGTQFVTLYYDPIESTLEIKPTIDKSRASCKATKQRSGALLISGKGFFDKTGIHYSEESRVLEVEWNQAKGRIVVKLN